MTQNNFIDIVMVLRSFVVFVTALLTLILHPGFCIDKYQHSEFVSDIVTRPTSQQLVVGKHIHHDNMCS